MTQTTCLESRVSFLFFTMTTMRDGVWDAVSQAPSFFSTMKMTKDRARDTSSSYFFLHFLTFICEIHCTYHQHHHITKWWCIVQFFLFTTSTNNYLQVLPHNSRGSRRDGIYIYIFPSYFTNITTIAPHNSMKGPKWQHRGVSSNRARRQRR